MGQIVVDTSRLPLLVLRFQGQVDDVAFDHYLAQVKRNLDRERRYVLLVDATEASTASASQRRLQADFMKTHQAALARHCAAAAFVITQPLIRGVLTAILWTQAFPFEHIVLKEVADAELWCRARAAFPTVPAKMVA